MVALLQVLIRCIRFDAAYRQLAMLVDVQIQVVDRPCDGRGEHLIADAHA